jgi:hypothetical protein
MRTLTGVLNPDGKLRVITEDEMGIFGKQSNRIDVDIHDTESGPYVTDVRGCNDGTRHALWKAAQSNACYDENGDMPSIHPDFTRERPPEAKLGSIIFHLFGR